MSKKEFQVIVARSEIQSKMINSPKLIGGSGIVIMKGIHRKQFKCLKGIAACNNVDIREYLEV